MPVTRQGDRTIQGVEYGLAKLCPLCDDPDHPVKYRERTMILYQGKPRWAHNACAEGVSVCHPDRRTK